MHYSARERQIAVIALLCNAMIWGMSWWPLRYLSQHGVHPLWTTFFFSFCALFWVLLRKRPDWHAFVAHGRLWILAGAAGLTNICFSWAMTIGDVIRVVLLFYMMPAWTILLAWTILDERPTVRSLLQLGVSLTGAFLVLYQPGMPLPYPQGVADWLGLAGGFFFALTNVCLRALREVSAQTRAFATFSGATVTSALGIGLGMAAGVLQQLPAWHWDWMLITLFFSGFVTVANFALQYGSPRLLARTTSLIMICEILFASVSSILAGVSQPSMALFLGGLLIVLSAMWSFVSYR